MADWPMGTRGVNYTYYNGAQPIWLNITSSASVNTKGSWYELAATTSHDIDVMFLSMMAASAVTDCLIDVGVGAAGSELVVVENLVWSRLGTSAQATGTTLELPIYIPAGSRIALRIQGAVGSSLVGLLAVCMKQGGGSSNVVVNSKITTYGANTADSGGIGIDCGTSANTKGAYSEITAACDRIRSMFFMIGNQAASHGGTGYFNVDIAVGAAGSEEIILPDWKLICTAVMPSLTPFASPVLPIDIPAGTRIAARGACSSNNATIRRFDIILYGVS